MVIQLECPCVPVGEAGGEVDDFIDRRVLGEKTRDRQDEVDSDPGPAGYGSRQILKPGQDVPAIIDEVELGRIAVADIRPRRPYWPRNAFGGSAENRCAEPSRGRPTTFPGRFSGSSERTRNAA